MLDPVRVAACLEAMHDSVAVPVTVKTRLGVDAHDDYEFLQRFIGVVAQAGCRTVILHARKAWLSGLSPKQNRDVPPLDYARVGRLKRDFPHLEIIVNGGITSTENAIARLQDVDGVMIGRAAWRQPMLISELDARLYDCAAVSRLAALEAFIPYLERALAADHSLRHVTRHLSGLFAGQHNGRAWRIALAQLRDDRRGLQALQRFVVRARQEGVLEPGALAA